MMAKQRDAMAPLGFMDGVWRGPAWTLDPTGKSREVTQTERVGSFLDGTPGFRALGVVSYDVTKKTLSMRSWAQGRSGDFPFTPTADGFVWTTPAGPNATVRYTAVIKDGAWREVGEYLVEGREPRQIFEMNLRRVEATQWPEDGAVTMQ